MGSAISTPTFQAVNANIANDGSADSPRGYAVSSGASGYTFTATGASRVRYSAPSGGACTVTLPTTGIKAGAEFELIVTGATEANYVVLKSSGADEVDRIGGEGKITVIALQDAPTSAAHWRVKDVWERTSTASGVYTFSGGGTITGCTISFARNNKNAVVFFGNNSATASATMSGILTLGTLPARFLGVGFTDMVIAAGGTQAVASFSLSNFEVYSNLAGNGFPASGGANGLTLAQNVSYILNT